MTFLDLLRQRLQSLLAERTAAHDQMQTIVAAAQAENRADLTDDEHRLFEEARASIANIDSRIAETTQRVDQIEEQEAQHRATVAAVEGLIARGASIPATTGTNIGGAHVTHEPAIYSRRSERSFFADLVSRRDDPEAAQRIAHHSRQMEALVERRVGTTANLAGVIPPQYLVDLFAPIIRGGRITANLVNTSIPLPPYGTTFNLGRGTTGLAVDVQASENATLATADYDDTLLTFNLTTIGGYTDVSRQEIERSVGGDQIIMQDLASLYAFRANQQVIAGSGAAGQLKGLLNATGTIAVTYTDATPTVGEIYAKIADALQQVNTQRMMPASCIVMHPRRWGWFTASLDTAGRPLVNVNEQAFNPIGHGDAATGVRPSPVGSLLGVNVYTDPGVPINLGAGTNEDRIIVGRLEDAILMEDEGVVPYRVYEEPGAAALTLRLVLAGYAAFTAERYASAIATISGTGLITPTF